MPLTDQLAPAQIETFKSELTELFERFEICVYAQCPSNILTKIILEQIEELHPTSTAPHSSNYITNSPTSPTSPPAYPRII